MAMDIKSEIRVLAAERRKVLKSTNLSYFLPGHTQHYFLFCSSKVFPVRLPEAHFTPFCTLKDDVPEKNPFMGVVQITRPQARAHAFLGNLFTFFCPQNKKCKN